MKCPKCQKEMYVINGGFHSEEGTTEVFLKHNYLCTNPNCEEFAGNNLNNPSKIAFTKDIKVN